MKYIPVRLFMSLFLLASVLFFSRHVIAAEGKSGLTIALIGKNNFLITQKSQTLSKALIITNSGTLATIGDLRPVTIDTENRGGLVPDLSTHPLRDIASYIHIDSPSRIQLAPRERRVITFTITIPARISVGDHKGAIAFTNEAVTTLGSLNSRESFLAGFQVTVAGQEKESLAGGPVSYSDQSGIRQVLIGLTNTGNKLIKSRGTITILTSMGDTVISRAVSIDTILPGSTIAYPFAVSQVSPGTYSVHTVLTYGTGKELDITRSFTVSATQEVATSIQTVVQSSNPITLWIIGILSIFLIGWFVLLPLGKRMRRGNTRGDMRRKRMKQKK